MNGLGACFEMKAISEQTAMRFLQAYVLLLQSILFATDFDSSFLSASFLKAQLCTATLISSTEQHVTEAPETTGE